MEWDTGAAHAVANESGNSLKALNSEELLEHKYNKKNLLNKWFVVKK